MDISNLGQYLIVNIEMSSAENQAISANKWLMCSVCSVTIVKKLFTPR